MRYSLTCATLIARWSSLPSLEAHKSLSKFLHFGRSRYLTGALIAGKGWMCICNKTANEWNWISFTNHDLGFGVSSLKKGLSWDFQLLFPLFLECNSCPVWLISFPGSLEILWQIWHISMFFQEWTVRRPIKSVRLNSKIRVPVRLWQLLIFHWGTWGTRLTCISKEYHRI